MKIIGLQGVYSDGHKNIGRLLHLLEQHNYKTYHKQYTLTIPETFCENEINDILDDIEPLVETGDVLLGHSAGCLLICKLLERLKLRGVTIPVVWFFNAGVDRDRSLPDNVSMLYNVVDPSDGVIAAAGILPYSELGSMGQKGYAGPNSNVIDISYEYDKQTTPLNHGEFFDSQIIGLPIEQILQSIASI